MDDVLLGGSLLPDVPADQQDAGVDAAGPFDHLFDDIGDIAHILDGVAAPAPALAPEPALPTPGLLPTPPAHTGPFQEIAPAPVFHEAAEPSAAAGHGLPVPVPLLPAHNPVTEDVWGDPTNRKKTSIYNWPAAYVTMERYDFKAWLAQQQQRPLPEQLTKEMIEDLRQERRRHQNRKHQCNRRKKRVAGAASSTAASARGGVKRATVSAAVHNSTVAELPRDEVTVVALKVACRWLRDTLADVAPHRLDAAPAAVQHQLADL